MKIGEIHKRGGKDVYALIDMKQKRYLQASYVNVFKKLAGEEYFDMKKYVMSIQTRSCARWI